MQFISLKKLSDSLHYHGDYKGTDETLKLLQLLEINSKDDFLQIDNTQISKTEVKKLIESLDVKKIIFYDWTEQHKELLKILEGDLPAHPFKDKFNWKGHAMFPDFQKFIHPFLHSVLLDQLDKISLEKISILFSFLILLPEEERIHAEQKLFKPIKELVNALKEDLEKVESEQDLSKITQEICNEQIKTCINYLSRASYSSKLWYVDQLLWVIKQKGCTLRLANWILKQLEEIELNPEHREKIASLKKDLLEGRIKTKNTMVRNKFIWKLSTVFSASLVLILVALIIWFAVEKPFSESDDNDMQSTTSYQQFTKEERIKIDSLLKEIQQTNSPEADQIDPNQPVFGNGISVSVRVPWRNNVMEDLYADLQIDASLHENNLIDSCAVFSSKISGKKFYKGVNDAKTSKGDVEVMMKNESGYDVYFLAFENEKNGKIFSVLVKKGTTHDLKFKRGYKFLFLPGNQLGKFVAPQNATELPSKDFDHHFCNVDINFSESLLNIYELKNPKKGKNKLLFSGDVNAYFTVVDLYGFLELN